MERAEWNMGASRVRRPRCREFSRAEYAYTARGSAADPKIPSPRDGRLQTRLPPVILQCVYHGPAKPKAIDSRWPGLTPGLCTCDRVRMPGGRADGCDACFQELVREPSPPAIRTSHAWVGIVGYCRSQVVRVIPGRRVRARGEYGAGPGLRGKPQPRKPSARL